MKCIIRNLGLHINLLQGSWWIFWEIIFLKCRMYDAFDVCSHNFRISNQNLRLYEDATMNW